MTTSRIRYELGNHNCQAMKFALTKPLLRKQAVGLSYKFVAPLDLEADPGAGDDFTPNTISIVRELFGLGVSDGLPGISGVDVARWYIWVYLEDAFDWEDEAITTVIGILRSAFPDPEQVTVQDPTELTTRPKIKVGDVPNPDIIIFHLTVPLIRPNAEMTTLCIDYYRKLKDGDSQGSLLSPAGNQIVRSLMSVDGVVDLFIGAFYVHVEKGSAFEWEILKPKILAILKNVYDEPDKVLIL